MTAWGILTFFWGIWVILRLEQIADNQHILVANQKTIARNQYTITTNQLKISRGDILE